MLPPPTIPPFPPRTPILRSLPFPPPSSVPGSFPPSPTSPQPQPPHSPYPQDRQNKLRTNPQPRQAEIQGCFCLPVVLGGPRPQAGYTWGTP